jgi:hypothetical protein
LAVGVRLEATMFRLMKSVFTVPRFLAGALHWGFQARQGANAHRMRPPFFRFLVKSKSRENEKSYLRNCIWEKHG